MLSTPPPRLDNNDILLMVGFNYNLMNPGGWLFSRHVQLQELKHDNIRWQGLNMRVEIRFDGKTWARDDLIRAVPYHVVDG